MTKISLSVFALLIGTSFTAQSAGFDCSLAKTKIEKMICSDAELSELDSQLKDVFIEAQGETAGIDAESGERIDPVGKENSKWIFTVRNKCSNASCLKTAYKSHIKQIQTKWLPSSTAEVNESCKKTLWTHGLLTRGQFQCGFSKYAEDMMQAAKECASTVSDKERKELLAYGMQLFDKNEAAKGHDKICNELLSDFPTILAR
ncbi:MAG: hypothetical protein WCJ11_12215 [Methylococcaceae bacterium]